MSELGASDDAEDTLLLYQTEDGQVRVEVRLDNDTVWLSQAQLGELLATTKQNVGQHIRRIFSERELVEEAVVKDFFTTAADGKRYKVRYYNLDVIISVGYRVRSLRGTRFRIWATGVLRDYLVKGFALDDKRLKENSALDRYFDELVERIRDIRTSERQFYRKVADIYATSIDYDPKADLTAKFYANVQNKFHYAITGQTAAELIEDRADAGLPNMGLTNWPGERILARDVTVAKNYLSSEELSQLNSIVEQYLIFAESQAKRRISMKMADWVTKLHGFLTLNDREILTHLGKVTKEAADAKALAEYRKYRDAQALPVDYQSDFDRTLGQLGPGRPAQDGDR